MQNSSIHCVTEALFCSEFPSPGFRYINDTACSTLKSSRFPLIGMWSSIFMKGYVRSLEPGASAQLFQ